MDRELLYDAVRYMEPLVPEDREGKLSCLALEVIRRSERLRSALHPITRRAVVELVRSMNSYYSNLIEGHRTVPREIDAAVRREFFGDQRQRDLQQLHWAHIETQRWMEDAICSPGAPAICGAEFLRSVHREFYTRLPREFQEVEDEKGKREHVEPGELRNSVVSVGIHLAPVPERLPAFLDRFQDVFGPLVLRTPRGLVAGAAAHHRLAWIHPFLDGNGRVTRLFTQAWLQLADASADGLWTLSRGLARRQSGYKAALANADERRLNDFDGRGYLSERRLSECCAFLLETAIDQLDFMHDLLDLEKLQNRIMGYAERRESAKELPSGCSLVLREVFLRGEIPRGDVARVLNVSPRTAQGVTGELLREALLVSDSAKRPVRLGFPANAAASYFPNLFPAGSD
jgi:Fic family protein